MCNVGIKKSILYKLGRALPAITILLLSMTNQNKIMTLNNKTTYHFIGVGGIGMSGLAELLVRQGLASAARIWPRAPSPGGWQTLGVRVHQATGPKTWATPTSWSTPPR